MLSPGHPILSQLGLWGQMWVTHEHHLLLAYLHGGEVTGDINKGCWVGGQWWGLLSAAKGRGGGERGPLTPSWCPPPSALLSVFSKILPEGREMKAGLTLPCLPCLPCLPTSFPAHSSPSFISPGVPVRTQRRGSPGWRRPWRFPLC